MTQQTVFVNPAVGDLGASGKFCTAPGYGIGERFGDEDTASVVIGGSIVAALHPGRRHAEFAKKEIAGPTRTGEVPPDPSSESRGKVDERLGRALAAGGSVSGETRGEGFLHGRSFDDPDGPTREVVWMSPSAPEG